MMLFMVGAIILLTLLAPAVGCIIMGAVIAWHVFNKRPKGKDNDKLDK
jgi:hypothetical protein